MKSSKSYKPKHVLFFTYHLPLESEPGAFRPWMEARLLKRAGYEVTVITSGVQYMTGEDIRPYKAWCTEEMVEGIRILRTWAPKHYRRSLFHRIFNYISYAVLAGLASILKVRKVDRVFAGTHPIFIMPIVYLVSLIKRAPMVLDERDLYPETAIALGIIKPGLFSKFLFKLQQFFRKKTVGILAATPGIRKRLIDYGISPQKIFLLYNADVFLNNSLPSSGDGSLFLHKLINKKILVGYVGGLGKVNDILTLLKAAKRLKNFDQLGFVIVGSGEKKEEYIKFCKKNDLDNVLFLPAVPRKEARNLIRQLDICIQALPKNEHFSSTLTSKTFDYHALGKPMIFCGSGDTAELLQKSGGGVVVPSENDEALAEAIKLLVKNPSLRKKMGESARQWYEKNINIEKACIIIQKAIEGYNS
ncbi:MAG: Glycosyltransferase involved in cell wall bisynthesis [Thermodesulfobacteria bacterium]|nr:glycosyltransferase family 4 protein [Thermodesulfobacteriota bacterium]MCU4138631.1 Glycosyltransferase involved in cell wall bisynthesis [Thermodesulfobacteriota bacterium]